MSARGRLRRAAKAMDAADTIELLESAEAGRLATVGPDGYPYVIAVNHAYEPVAGGLGNIYFHCALEGHKLDNIRFNGKVCFEVDVSDGIKIGEGPCNCTTIYRSAVAFGVAHIIDDTCEKRKALGLLVAKLKAGNPDDMPEKALASTCVVKIVIDTLTGKCSI
jgi:nitroimidazol reductase NimA-like FMN-containing flavoprotein (pyridoxamine 5'-phosphate oxidase superfamily)